MTSAHEIDRHLADLVRNERHLAVQFVVELARFAKRELYREFGYTSLFYYCVRQLRLSKSSAFRRSEVARLVARFPVIADRLVEDRISIRALVELRDVLTGENHVEVLTRAEGKSQEEAQLLAVEYRPRPIPRDVVRTLPIPVVVPVSTSFVASAEVALVPTGTTPPAPARDIIRPLTPNLRRLNVTVSADFMAELEEVRAVLSHKYPDGHFEQVVREAFKLVLERNRKRKALTNPSRELRKKGDSRQQGRGTRCRQSDGKRSVHRNGAASVAEMTSKNNRYVPAAVKRAVWKRDRGTCTWLMGDGQRCGSTHKLEFDHDLEVVLGGKPTLDNIRLLCKGHNLMKAEQHLGKAMMAKFRKNRGQRSDSPSG